LRRHPQKRRIYVVLDNAAIHRAKAVGRYLEQLDGRIQLWFLPPFCPDPNPVEREWQAYHAAVTVLHHHASLKELLARTRVYFVCRLRCCVRRLLANHGPGNLPFRITSQVGQVRDMR